MYDLVASAVLQVPTQTPTGRRRRCDQTVWTTIVREGWMSRKRGISEIGGKVHRRDDTEEEEEEEEDG